MAGTAGARRSSAQGLQAVCCAGSPTLWVWIMQLFAQKVSALCCLPGRSLGAKPQHGASLCSHLCVNAS